MKVVRKEASQDPLPEGNIPLQLAMALNHDIQCNEEGNFMGEATELALVEHIVEDLGQKGIRANSRKISPSRRVTF